MHSSLDDGVRPCGEGRAGEGRAGEGRGGQQAKDRIYLKKYWLKFSESDKNYKPMDLRSSSRINTKKTSPRHIMTKLLKITDNGEEILKADGGKIHYIRGNKEKNNDCLLIRNNGGRARWLMPITGGWIT